MIRQICLWPIPFYPLWTIVQPFGWPRQRFPYVFEPQAVQHSVLFEVQERLEKTEIFTFYKSVFT